MYFSYKCKKIVYIQTYVPRAVGGQFPQAVGTLPESPLQCWGRNTVSSKLVWDCIMRPVWRFFHSEVKCSLLDTGRGARKISSCWQEQQAESLWKIQRQLAACRSGKFQPQTSAPRSLYSDRNVWTADSWLSSITARTLTTEDSAKRSLLIVFQKCVNDKLHLG